MHWGDLRCLGLDNVMCHHCLFQVSLGFPLEFTGPREVYDGFALGLVLGFFHGPSFNVIIQYSTLLEDCEKYVEICCIIDGVSPLVGKVAAVDASGDHMLVRSVGIPWCLDVLHIGCKVCGFDCAILAHEVG
jgi:hypothetical protein